ncbi:MAG TPA: bifunctional 3-(3-hydroxy-phenyl)propionate/3-hydroxycinnamic acid hydroxylase [Solirubrobacteraceae bacterium]|nr:bifunctional 3-(3-hydroxy-phenyl)propionate/3-hydroxycinnamic acid hydroxylase [Solirubrobacteraceae bacterium]
MTDSGGAHVDVAVVGLGSCGLVLTQLLALEGLRVAAIDRARIPIPYPRATHLDDETMRAFQTIGLTDLEKTFSLVGKYNWYDPDWRLLLTMSMSRGLTEQGWQSDYMFHQPDFEAVLRGRAVSRAETTTYFGSEVVAVSQTDTEVSITLRDRPAGRTQQVFGKSQGKGERDEASRGTRTVTASFVVGCDGANSFLRTAMQSTHVDYGATHRSLIVDILPFRESEALAGGHFGRDSFIQTGIRNPLTFVPISEPLLRFEEMLRPDDDTSAFDSLEYVHSLLEPWLKPDEYRILRADVYEWDAVVAEPWQVGRMFLAGDAAHEMPPHLGQGMCSGVRDAMTLAWKLGRVIRGESSLALLRTYETERKPHVTEYVKTSAEMANQIEAFKPEDLDGAEMTPPEADWPRPRLGPGVRSDDGDEFAGTLSAQPNLESGERLDDAVGYRFAVVGNDACVDTISADTQAQLDAMNVKVVNVSSGEVNDWLVKLGVSAVLVRPDRYIFGSAQSGLELADLVAELADAMR